MNSLLSKAASKVIKAELRKESPNNRKDHQVNVAMARTPFSVHFHGFSLECGRMVGVISMPGPVILATTSPMMKKAKDNRTRPI